MLFLWLEIELLQPIHWTQEDAQPGDEEEERTNILKGKLWMLRKRILKSLHSKKIVHFQEFPICIILGNHLYILLGSELKLTKLDIKLACSCTYPK